MLEGRMFLEGTPQGFNIRPKLYGNSSGLQITHATSTLYEFGDGPNRVRCQANPEKLSLSDSHFLPSSPFASLHRIGFEIRILDIHTLARTMQHNELYARQRGGQGGFNGGPPDDVLSTTTPTTTTTSVPQSSLLATATGLSVTSSGIPQSTSAVPDAANSDITASASSATSPFAATAVSDDAARLHAEQNQSGSSMSSGAIAAAVAVPLILLALLGAVFFLLRRRRRRQSERASVFMQDMAQNKPAPHPIHEHYTVPPVNVGAPIAAYYTGLDTGSDRASSHNPTRFSDDVPPPYGSKGPRAAAQAQQTSVPLINIPASDGSDAQSIASWRTAPNNAAYLDSAGTRDYASSRQSISSTAYSDNASLHSARAARMSIGGALMVSTTAAENNSDPFDDPESPVSSVDGGEGRALTGNDNSRVVSPVSFASGRERV